MAANRLAGVILNLRSEALASVADFYTSSLGMASSTADAPGALRFAFPDAAESCFVEFRTEGIARDYRASRGDLYWKIGLAVDDVDAAADKLGGRRGNQFLDIGYLTHVADPAGFAIELLQTTFEASMARRAQLIEARRGAGGPLEQATSPCVGQITTRVTDADRSLRFYTNTLGMKLLSVQPVTQYGFTLYFLAYSADEPPNASNLEAVENREWLWQRPYTTLELQHVHSAGGQRLRATPAGEAGLHGLEMHIADVARWDTISAAPTFDSSSDEATITDPDGLRIALKRTCQPTLGQGS